MNNKEILKRAREELNEYLDMLLTGKHGEAYILGKIKFWTKSVNSIARDVDRDIREKK